LTDPATPILYMARLATAINFIAGFSMWSAKLPILLLYVRLFGMVTPWLRITAYAIAAVTFFFFLVGMSAMAAKCTPPSSMLLLTPDFFPECLDRGTFTGVLLGFVAVVTDLIIILLPLPVLSQLRLPPGKKVGVMVIFLTGIFAIAASAVALYFKFLSRQGASTDLTSSMVCTYVTDPVLSD